MRIMDWVQTCALPIFRQGRDASKQGPARPSPHAPPASAPRSPRCGSPRHHRRPESCRGSFARFQMTGQQDAEYRAGGPALARIFHHAAMIGDQLGDESKAKPASLWLAGDERLEQMIDDIGGRARSEEHTSELPSLMRKPYD